MSLITDLHLMICIAALLYIYQKTRTATESRTLGMILAGFVVFFIFFQHIWISFIFFIIMFGYLFLGGFTSGLMEGQMAGAWMHYMRNPPPSMFGGGAAGGMGPMGSPFGMGTAPGGFGMGPKTK